jgi:hypothetical protein
MANLYADQVAGVQDKIQNIQLNQIETYNDMADNITSKYNAKMAQYESKWKSVQEGGGEDLAAIIGIKGAYGAGKAAYNIYKKAKDLKNKLKNKKGEDDSKDDGDDEEEPKGFDEEDEEDEEEPKGFDDDDAGPADVPGTSGTLAPDIPASSLSSTGGAAAPGADLSGSVRIPSQNALGKRRAKNQGDDDEPEPEPDLVRGPLTDATPSNTNLATGGREELDNTGGEFEDFSNSLQTGGRTLSSTISTTVNNVRGAASEGEEAVQGFANKLYNKFGQSGRDMITKAKSFFSKSAGDTDATAAAAGEEGTTTVVAAAAEGGEVAAFGTTEAVLGAIPVVGEIALAVGGLVAIGDSIYHLFHHPKEAPAAPVATPVNIPQALTAKFSAALPSVDNATDRSSSMSAF